METDAAMVKVKLTLMDLSTYENQREEELNDILDLAFAKHSCYEAVDWLQWGESAPCCKSQLRKDVERFVRNNDKLLALGSLLLKNCAFFSKCHMRTENSQEKCSSSDMPSSNILVRLPRTDHRKPFLPTPTNFSTDSGDFSISHQFPYVGSAQRIDACSVSPVMVGCDIVVRESLNTQLYENWNEFLAVFEGSFATNEWEIIQRAKSSQARLNEFFLRWAVKEAYTKALGVGMALDFASFSIHFPSCDPYGGCISEFLASGDEMDTTKTQSMRGQVNFLGVAPAESSETWDFHFAVSGKIPLSWTCVAIGPVSRKMVCMVEIQRTTLVRLLSSV